MFLADLMQASFVLLGQRLLKIRDNELYLADGYKDFKSQFVEKAKVESARDLKDEIKQLKIKYGLAKEPEEIDRLDRAFNVLFTSIPSKLTAGDKKKIRNYIKKQ